MVALKEWIVETLLPVRRRRGAAAEPVRLDVGQRLSFGRPDARGNRWYASRLEALEPAPGAPLLVVAWPSERLALVPLHVGDEALVGLARAGDARYLVPTMVEALYRHGCDGSQAPLVVLRTVGQWRRHQERRFVRVPTGRWPAEGVWTTLGPDGAPVETVRPLRVRDLSAGGALLEAGAPFVPGELFDCRFELPGVGPLAVRARVVRLHEATVGRRQSFQAGVEFVDLPEAERERVFRWVFRELIRRRRQGVRE